MYWLKKEWMNFAPYVQVPMLTYAPGVNIPKDSRISWCIFLFMQILQWDLHNKKPVEPACFKKSQKSTIASSRWRQAALRLHSQPSRSWAKGIQVHNLRENQWSQNQLEKACWEHSLSGHFHLPVQILQWNIYNQKLPKHARFKNP